VLVFASGQPIPFDVGLARALPYRLGERNTFPEAEQTAFREALAKRLREARELAATGPAADSPLVQLLQGYSPPEVAHLKTDVFRERVSYSASTREALRLARAQRPASAAALALSEIEARLGTLDGVETGIIVDLLLSYRAVGAFDAMIGLFDRLPEVIRRTVLVREQYAFALTRKAAKAEASVRDELRDRASRVLEGLISERGASSETCGLLGRVYKDRWQEARETEPARARGLLRQAIGAYTNGFRADWRDAYPGINAATLLDIQGDAESIRERDALVPVVRYAVIQHMAGKKPDYWDHATLLELAVLANDQAKATTHIEDALGAMREYWEPETTANNLGLLRAARAARGVDVTWLERLIDELDAAARAKRGE
jgi:hypothetical protein